MQLHDHRPHGTYIGAGRYRLRCSCGWTLTRRTVSPGSWLLLHWGEVGALVDASLSTGRCATCGLAVPLHDLDGDVCMECVAAG